MTLPSLRFKPRAASLAIGGALAAISQPTSAVYQSPEGQGQVLIYPYYTVQSAGGNAFNTYLSVVNSTPDAKAAKVRFREGRNGREVLSFNLFLSPNDVWTAALGPADGSTGAPAKLVTADKSCTSPEIPADGVTFRNFAYAGSAADGGPTTLDRTREGYFEIIEMATLTGNAVAAVTQNAAGIPVDCGFVQSPNGLAANTSQFVTPPTGGLSGTYVLINVANGLSFSGNATALAQFSATTLYTNPGDAGPDLTSANPAFATTLFQSSFSSLNATVTATPSLMMSGATYANGRDAVSAALMKSAIENEYALDAATRSATDWIVTFPTKAFHVSPGSGVAASPFTVNFGSSGACEPISISLFNREEAQPPGSGGCGFATCPPGPPAPTLCWSSSVMTFHTGAAGQILPAISNVFGSVNAIDVPDPFTTANGWAQVAFVGINASAGLISPQGSGRVVSLATGATTVPGPIVQRGLPAIGFMARTLNNGLLNCTTFGGAGGTCVGSYGALMDHRSFTSTMPTP